MRKDIEIHINTGDIFPVAQNSFESRGFAWVSNPGGLTRYIYGEITIPASLPVSVIKRDGLVVIIPYTGKYKEFYVRVKRVFSENDYEYLQNPVNGTEWFLVRVAMYGCDTPVNAFASQLRKISDGAFLFRFDGAYANIYSALQSDVNIIQANRQNANLMLACVPTNNYRYPITGVGLIRWINSNMVGDKLPNVLRAEFADDGTPVISASFNFDNMGLSLQLDTTNVDATN